MIVTIQGKPLQYSSVCVPASKSLSHRFLIAAALAKETSVIRNLGESDDILATEKVLSQLGAVITRKDGYVIVEPIKEEHPYHGELIDCDQSGSTMRFIIPLLALFADECQVTGKSSLMKRPQGIYQNIFDNFRKEDNCWKYSGGLKPGKYTVDGNISSQFITGLLFALPLLNGESEIIVREPFESRPYVQMTIEALRLAGITVSWQENRLLVKGNQKYHGFEVTVPGDDSQAAFFIALAAINRTSIEIQGLNDIFTQGDRVMRNFAAEAGTVIRKTDMGYLFTGKDLSAISGSLADCPDLGPILMAMATQCYGTSCFSEVSRLRLKESDRIAAIEEELNKLNCKMKAEENRIWIDGVQKPTDSEVLSGHNDHRIVMALSVLASVCDHPVEIEGAEAVMKSYPEFFRDLANTGIKVSIK